MGKWKQRSLTENQVKVHFRGGDIRSEDRIFVMQGYGLNFVSQNSYIEVLTLSPQKVTVFGEKVFKG